MTEDQATQIAAKYWHLYPEKTSFFVSDTGVCFFENPIALGITTIEIANPNIEPEEPQA